MVRDVNLWLIYCLFPAVIGSILNVQDSGLFGQRGGHCVMTELEEEKDEIRKMPRMFSARWRLFTWKNG